MTEGPYRVVKLSEFDARWGVKGPGQPEDSSYWLSDSTAHAVANHMNLAYREGQASRDTDTGSWKPVEKVLFSCAEQVGFSIRALQDAERALIKQAARVQGRREAEEE